MTGSLAKQGFDLLGGMLCPSLVCEIMTWESHPELGKLLNQLQSAKKRKQFLDHYAEALLARHFMKVGARVDGVEIANPKGKTADLRILSDGVSIYVHSKRLNIDKITEERLSNSAYLPFGFFKDRIRFIRLLKDAYDQFMPAALNVIVITTFSGEDIEDFKAALLGQGSARPGFWNAEHHNSTFAVWFSFELSRDAVRFKRFFRDTFDVRWKPLLERLFPENSGCGVS